MLARRNAQSDSGALPSSQLKAVVGGVSGGVVGGVSGGVSGGVAGGVGSVTLIVLLLPPVDGVSVDSGVTVVSRTVAIAVVVVSAAAVVARVGSLIVSAIDTRAGPDEHTTAHRLCRDPSTTVPRLTV